jgi:aminopeptidase N
VIAATGAETARTVSPDGWATAHYVLGPAREFTLLLSPHFQVVEAESLGTRVRSYFRPEDEIAGRSALHSAIGALQVYSDEFGPYPYREMAVVQAPLTFHGMEFPGMNLIGTDDYSSNLDDLEKLVVHEVAHQWWYNQVGSDQPAVPWLDEGLAEWSMYMYFLKRYGQPEADRLRQLRWEVPVTGLVNRNADAPIGLPVKAYPSDSYETVVYGKGALFFATLRDEIGPEAFRQLLRTYLERYQWETATPAGFQALAEEVSGKDMDGLFAQWVGAQEIATVK